MAADTGVPAEFNCDVCNVCAFQFFKALNQTEEARPPSKRAAPLSEADYEIAISESYALSNDDISNYGPRLLGDGSTALGGRGLYEDDPLNGMQMSGGLWVGRIQGWCGAIAEEVGEKVLYDKFGEVKAATPAAYWATPEQKGGEDFLSRVSYNAYQQWVCDAATKCGSPLAKEKTKKKRRRRSRRGGAKKEEAKKEEL
jgi:hypothetical protein